jgi:hypothetical protein
VIAELERIRAELPDLNENDLDFYVSLVDAHEDELAWQCLVLAARDNGAPISVWNRLHAAAQTMGLQEDDEQYGPTFAEAVALVRQQVEQPS